MKILLVTSFFPPTHTAGTEKRTLGYAQSLQRLGHEVQVLCAGRWDTGDQYWNGHSDETYQGISVRRINLNWILASDTNGFLYRNPIVQRYLSHWLIEWKPDIMHITSCVTLSASIIESARDLGIPIILTLTDFWFVCPRINLVRGDGSLCDGLTTAWDCLKCLLWDTKAYRGLRSVLPEQTMVEVLKTVSRHPIISRQRGLRGMAFDMDDRKDYLSRMLRSVDYVTAPSETVCDIVENCLPLEKEIRLIHSGHDLSWMHTVPPKRSNARIRIGYIGQVIPIKGVHILVSAFEKAGFTSQAELSIFGDHAKDPAYLKSLRKSQGASIEFRGAFPHELLGEILSEIDVLAVPSLWHENNPRVIQEAFASGTPVIASDVGGIAEFVGHEVNGLLFERGNVEDLSQQLQRVVFEPDLLPRLQAGIAPVRSIDDEISEFERLYEELVARRETQFT